MDTLMNRRSILRGAAGIGATAALTTAVPFTTTTTDTTDTTTAPTQAIAPTLAMFAAAKPWPEGDDWDELALRRSAFVIRPESPGYDTVLEALRSAHQLRHAWTPGVVQYTIEWVWALPAPMRDAFMGLIENISRSWQVHIENAMSNVLYSWVFAQGVTCEDDDGDYVPATASEMCDALSQPTTMAAAIMAMCEALDMPIDAWLNGKDGDITHWHNL